MNHVFNNKREYKRVKGFNLFWGSEVEVKSLWSKYVGLHMRYKGKHSEMRRSNLKQILKNYHSSDCSLKLVYMKSESLVIVN